MLFTTLVATLALTGSFADARPLNYRRQAAITDFGSCGSPEINFAVGLDGRKDPSFQAVNLNDFNHGSALNAKVITEFICGQLKNKCKAPDATVAACDKGNTDAQALGKTGAAADAFNAAFGIKTNLAAGDAAASSGAAAGGAANAGSATDFGSCGSPEIKFAVGLDGRKEPAFIAVNQGDFNHGSAQNSKVITDFICQQLGSKCKASAAAISACTKGAADADALGKVGAAADAFNAAFGIKTDFANANVGGADNANAGNANANANAGAAAPPAQGGALNLGTCTDPSVKLGLGFDGRKELSFINNNSKDFSHGSALNPGVIFNATCDTLVNKCGLKNGDEAVNVCRDAATRASALGKSGAAADLFNAAFGIKTNFVALTQ